MVALCQACARDAVKHCEVQIKEVLLGDSETHYEKKKVRKIVICRHTFLILLLSYFETDVKCSLKKVAQTKITRAMIM